MSLINLERCILSLVISFVSVIAAMPQQTLISSPNLSVNGNAGTTAPFDLGESIFQSMRYQQVFSLADFQQTMPLGGYITAIRFDVATAQNGGHGFIGTLPSLQISFSTTLRGVDGLSSLFSENVGLDNTVVFGTSSITLSDASFGGADILIPFSTPFFYNPSAGNLLMDVRNFGGGITDHFSANNAFNDTTSSVYSGGSVNDSSGFITTIGLTSLFEVTPVPEPGTWVLLLVGLGCCWSIRFPKARGS